MDGTRVRERDRELYPVVADGLPRLPQKARPRLDHQGFREQGDKVARERINKIQSKISSLVAIEERLKTDQEKLCNSARKDLSVSSNEQSHIQESSSKVDDPELRILYEDVTKEFQKTEAALEYVLRWLDKQSPDSNGEWTKIGLDLEKQLQRAIKKKGQLQSKKDDLENSLEGYSRARSMSQLEDETDLDTDGEDSGSGSSRRSRAPLRTEGNETVYSNEESRRDDGHPEHRKDDSLAEAGILAHESKGEGETKDLEDHCVEQKDQGGGDGVHESERTSLNEMNSIQAIKRRRSSSRKRSEARRHREKMMEKMQEQFAAERRKAMLLGEIRSISRRIKDQDRDIKSLKRDLGKWTKDADADDKQPGDDQEREEEYKRRMREQDEEWLEESKRQEVAVKRLRRLRRNIIEKGYHSNYTMRRVQAFRHGSHFYSGHFAPSYPDLSRDDPDSRGGIDSDSELTDSSRDDTDNRVHQHLLSLLEKMIREAQKLEEHTQKLQDHLEKFESVVGLKEVLEDEKNLEEKGLKMLGDSRGLSQLASGTNQTNNLSNDHLSGRPIADSEIYKPLKKGQFRVLVLLPAPESYYPLLCRLETWHKEDLSRPTMSESPRKQYAALSYFWGPEIHNGRIYLMHSKKGLSDPNEWGSETRRATRIRIRNNLFRALLRLRRSGPNSQEVALWVDFMSINQKDLNEKTDQLSRMVNIYSNASNVCVWLGESDNDGRSDMAMEFISTIMDFAVLDRHARDKSQAMKWNALGELMRDRWFSRRWVVQEIALSKDATVHCGERIVRWSDFADAASLLVSNQETIKSLFELSEWREGRKTLGDVDSFGASILLEATNNLFRRKPNGEIKKPIKNIESLVTSLKTFDAGDQRDLIYSLVYIASDTSHSLWHHNSDRPAENELTLGVNYNKSEVTVYKDFTWFCIVGSQSLDLICRPWAMPPKGEEKLPSWIPLLSCSEFGIPEEVYSGRKNGDSLVGPTGAPRYEACGKNKFDPLFNPQARSRAKRDNANPSNMDENRILFARGIKIATINEVSPRNTGGVILRESLRMGGWEGFKPNTDSVPDRVWRTLVADRTQGGYVPPSWYQRACLRCLEIADTFNNGDLNVGELLEGKSEMLRKYLMRVRNVTWNRRFFTAIVHNTQSEERAEAGDGRDGSREYMPPLSTHSIDSPPFADMEPQYNEAEEGGERADGKGADDMVQGEGNDSKGEEMEDLSGKGQAEEKEGDAEGAEPEETKEGNDAASREEIEEEEERGDKENGSEGARREQEGEDSEEARGEDSEEAQEDGEKRESREEQKDFGLCPPQTEKGDIICILHGCTVPVVLRKKEDGHMELVGEAYVHGKMDGEAMEESPGNNIWVVEEFQIQ